MNVKQRYPQSGSPIVHRRVIFPLLFFIICARPSDSAIHERPRLLVTSADAGRIVSTILHQQDKRDEFTNFVQDKTFISVSCQMVISTPHLRCILNKIMKNSFLYMIGQMDSRIRNIPGFESDPLQYMRNIESELLFLLADDNIRKIQQLGGLQGPGHAVKSLAIVYDWGYGYFRQSDRIRHADIESALRAWGAWFTAPGRYYGSVFANHAPWGAKSLAYIAASLGDEKLFTGSTTKIQASKLPQSASTSIAADVNVSAKGFFDQLMHSVNFVAYPRGGWHESVSYYLLKELPELLEYAEVVCTYHNDPDYTQSIYSSSIFKNAGSFLLQMTTPDGMLQKIGDSGEKTALPAESYRPGGNTYGDINSVGAGYISGYFLNRLCSRIRETPGNADHAELIQYYIDNYCFDYAGVVPSKEPQINLLYFFLWPENPGKKLSFADIKDSPLLTASTYFDNSGILISRSPDIENPDETVVRFDAQPYYYSSHQHFAAGNFTIYKGASLAIDGGRYTSYATTQTKSYYEDVYRHSVSHNVVLIGDRFAGQKSFHTQADHAPYTVRQLNPFQEYGTGPQNVAVFLSDEFAEQWACPWTLNSMVLRLGHLYDHAGVDEYDRYMIHLKSIESAFLLNDLVVVYDTISMTEPLSSHWQMHFRDNGKNMSLGDSIYVIVRDESIDKRLVKSGFGSLYSGQLAVKSLLPATAPSIVPFEFPDSICDHCWNGRVWEESTHILRYSSPANRQHEFLNVLAPFRKQAVTEEWMQEFAGHIRQIDRANPLVKSVVVTNPSARRSGETESLYISIIDPQHEQQDEYSIRLNELSGGWFFIAGVKEGEWQIEIIRSADDIVLQKNILAFEGYRNQKQNVLVFPVDVSAAESMQRGGAVLSLERIS